MGLKQVPFVERLLEVPLPSRFAREIYTLTPSFPLKHSLDTRLRRPLLTIIKMIGDMIPPSLEATLTTPIPKLLYSSIAIYTMSIQN